MPHEPTPPRAPGSAKRLMQAVIDLTQQLGIADRVEVRLTCPVVCAVDRELTDADHVEASRLAREEWKVVVQRRRP
jgi:hypothetical protein